GNEITLHFRSRIKTTSLLVDPRASAILLPSRSTSNQVILSLVKAVSCLGSPPPRGRRQRFDTPAMVFTYMSAAPSADQRTKPVISGSSEDASKICVGSPPAAGIIRNFSPGAPMSTDLPSGDIHAPPGRSQILTGVPPSTGIRHMPRES